MQWFDVDKAGLAKLLEHRGKGFAVLELLQNSWDQNVTHVGVSLRRFTNSPYVEIIVTDDDPEGFTDLTHAFTLFAESAKKHNPEKRGRFNLGEKLVLACCTTALIRSTTGGVQFDENGRSMSRRWKTSAGSIFSGTMRMTADELHQVEAEVRRTIPPVTTVLHVEEGGRVVDDVLEAVPPVTHWHASLSTEIADDDGFLRSRNRLTKVLAYELRPGERGTLYEMGIPVVETGDRWHVSVQQKVPLTLDRTNVPPAYLSAVRVGLFNALAQRLTSVDEATDAWVRDAAGHAKASPDAVRHVLDLRFGTKRVAYDPSDPEANKIAVSKGFTVVSGGSLSGREWENARLSELVPPAGQVTPSPKPFHPDGELLKLVITPTPSMADFVRWATLVGSHVLNEDVTIVLADDPGWGFNGCMIGQRLTVNVAKFGGATKFFVGGPSERLTAFLVHEFAHRRVTDHLSAEFHEECCRLGARLAFAVAQAPSLMHRAMHVE